MITSGKGKAREEIMKSVNGFEKKILSDINSRKKPVLLTETERVEAWRNRFSESSMQGSAKKMCDVMDFDSMSFSGSSISDYDVIYIDNSDLFFRFITGGCSALVKKNAEIIFEQNELAS